MSDRRAKLRSVGRSASTDSTDYSITMGKSVREKRKKPKERWLLTRKTWRYMADAGRKLIPDGASNRPEDIPKIEAYFQEVCRKESKFLLWRKNSYPGALGFRKKKKDRRKVQSCRNAVSADDVDTIKPERPKDLAIFNISGGRFDIRKMRQDFLMNSPPSPSGHLPFIPEQKVPSTENVSEQSDDISKNDEKLITMLEKFLTLDDKPRLTPRCQADFNYNELVDKLQRHLTLVSRNVPPSSSRFAHRPGSVEFEGDHREKSLTETLSRYFSTSTNRDKVISDLLTNRKALEKLYFELRKTKGFRGRSSGSPYSSTSQLSDRDKSFSSSNLRHIDSNRDKERERRIGITQPPPVIEIVQETPEIRHTDWGIQTLPIPEIVLTKCEEEYKKELAARKEEERALSPRSASRRRSSVDNDDISQSVSDTIKRYLRMARKKSVDSDKADRFKRVNYDRNLRNIKAKGEITKPGDDDGLNKGCQTNEEWILTYRDLKFREISDDSRFSSSRSSVDAGVLDEKSPTTSPPHTKSHHSFLSHFLPGKNHDKHDKSSATVPTGASAMQKSKSSSSVMHHGSRLMAKKIFRTRSKSQSRVAQPHCNWMPQGSCVWTSVSGRQVILSDTSLLQLSEIERKVLQKVAIAKLQALNLGVNIKIPTETTGTSAPKKRRPHLLKRKAITTSIFDTSRKDGDGNAPSGLVFGIPLTQCVENDRISRAAAGTPRYKGSDTGADGRLGRRGSRSSFSSLIDTHREGSSCESLMGQERMAGSVPGLLDKISCSSTADLPDRVAAECEELTIPNILSACIKHIERNGLRTLGIFRVSTSKKRIRELRENFDSGRETILDQEQCPHDVATLLKEYLRELPDPLLCRELYQAFVQTQRIRNRRLQFEALQHLIQILPSANRDTLHALLNFLSLVAHHSSDTTDNLGEIVQGNKMDSNNLATVFAPNILHCIKPNSSKETASDRAEDRIDIINVVRTLIDHHEDLYRVPAEILDEVYLHMMDSHPEALDELLTKRDINIGAEESQEELDSESYSAPWSPTLPGSDMSVEAMLQSSEELPNTPTEKKRMWSREEFLHETAATGGPNISMRIRHKDKIRERSQRRKREESASRKRSSDDSGIGGFSSAINIISKLRGQREEDYQYGKNRSSSLESSSSTHTDGDFHRIQNISGGIFERRKSSPFVMDNAGVITASLTIPVQTQANQGLSYNFDDDIPFIEDADNGRQQLTIGVIKTPTAPPRRRQRSISGSDSSVGSTIQPITGCISLVQSTDSAVGSPVNYSSPIQNTPTSFSSSIAETGMFSSPPSWTSSPPTSPDSHHTSVNYIPDDNQVPRTRTHRIVSKDSPTLQKVTFIPIQEVQKTRMKEVRNQDMPHNPGALRETHDTVSSREAKDHGRTIKDTQDSAFSIRDNQEIQRVQTSVTKDFVQKTVQISSDICKSTSSPAFDPRESREPRYTPSISNIGNAVLKSKTADFEKIASTESRPSKIVTTTSTSLAEKKKYTKRRYTDTRHPTRHIPDSESLEFSNSNKEEDKNNSQSSQQVYKRRELISSVQRK